ncbi:hypothetical protein ACIA8K_38555 [Catenuloplanes sp. NPDC051500]|uniref:hypothetical protein n=1 Tax=Catenuloplanes sp. NPDC051500 TaxID=3363959 RepID=UPI0037A64709
MIEPKDPFDRDLPSPLAALAALRTSGEDSVIATNTISDRQRAMYVSTEVDENLARFIQQNSNLRLVVLSGSAGCGKSALIRNLQAAVPPGTFSQVIEDATHADSPSEDQTRTLTQAFTGFRNGVPGQGNLLLIAANTGLLLEFQMKLRERGETGVADLVAYVLGVLGVPAAPHVPEARAHDLNDHVLVIDLDQRPTSGGEGKLLMRMLQTFDPSHPGTVMSDTRRCGTCQVQQWCAPRTNAELLADPAVGRTIDQALEQIAYLRGRDIAPRQLWDCLAELALGSIDSASDPCESVAAAAAAQDYTAVWAGLLPNGAFLSPSGDLATELAGLDPSFRPAEKVHEVMASAGVFPDDDARAVTQLLGAKAGQRLAVETAAAALLSPDLPRARALVRCHWLAGALPPLSPVPAYLTNALISEPGDDIDRVLDVVAAGLVYSFGSSAEGSSYLPTESLAETRDARVLVRVDLDEHLNILPPRPLVANPAGSDIVGLRPLSGRLQIGRTFIEFDLPLFLLLQKAESGTLPSTVDIERFHSLRYAAERLGRTSAEDDTLPLLITDETRGTFRITVVKRRGNEQFKIVKVA